jgi:hypothetical protein
MNTKQSLLLDSISSFFLDNNQNMRSLLNIINDKRTSLRLIDWFVTNYSKKKNISYPLNVKNNEQFNVYNSYKGQLRSYSKKQFDPFNRSQPIDFYYEKDKFIKTTVCQLNFFRWAIQNNIMEYIETHKGDIENDMNSSINYDYKKKSESADGTAQPKQIRKKRRELSVCASKFLNNDDVTIIVTFDK